MKILFGILNNYTDITNICNKECLIDGYYIIPEFDIYRLSIFGDPLPGILKHIRFITDNKKSKVFYEGDIIKVRIDQLEFDDGDTQDYIENNIINIGLNNYNFDNIIINNIPFSYNNLYEYDRNIPEEYKNKLKNYEIKRKELLDFDNMEKIIKKQPFCQTVFYGLYNPEKYKLIYTKEIAIDILLNKSFSFNA
jgi:hypothetical protein